MWLVTALTMLHKFSIRQGNLIHIIQLHFTIISSVVYLLQQIISFSAHFCQMNFVTPMQNTKLRGHVLCCQKHQMPGISIYHEEYASYGVHLYNPVEYIYIYIYIYIPSLLVCCALMSDIGDCLVSMFSPCSDNLSWSLK